MRRRRKKGSTVEQNASFCCIEKQTFLSPTVFHVYNLNFTAFRTAIAIPCVLYIDGKRCLDKFYMGKAEQMVMIGHRLICKNNFICLTPEKSSCIGKNVGQ